MRLTALSVLAFMLYGCATDEQGMRFRPDEVSWIKKYKTTRAEVVARFGLPPVELPQSSNLTSTTTTKTITAVDSEGQTEITHTITKIQRPSHLRKAIYVSTQRDAAVFPFYDSVDFTQYQLWVVYDERGVVLDYGFLGDHPDSPVDRHQQTIATAPQLTEHAAEYRDEP